MTFLTDLELHPLGNRQWRLTRDFVADTKAVGLITVPKGFVTDLNSIPRFLWWESTPSDYAETSVLHDYCYNQNRVPQSRADALYREGIIYQGGGECRAWARYLALWLFGGFAYNCDRNKPMI